MLGSLGAAIVTGIGMRKLLWATLLLAVLVTASVAATRAQQRDQVVIGMATFPATIHPLVGFQASRDYVLAVSRRSVTRFDASGAVVCQLCTEVPTVENGRVKVVDLATGKKGMEVTFTLRSGLKWGDGTQLTTKDVVFGAEVARSVQPVANVTGVVARDDHSYTVMLDSVRYDFYRLSPQPLNAAIEEPIFRAAKDPLDYGNKSAYAHAPEQAGLWNGPYLLTEFKPNESVTFTPNPFWDGEKPAFKHVIMRVFPSSAALEANMLSGDVDIANGLGFDQETELEKRYADRFDVKIVPGTTDTYYLYVQTESPLLSDKRVRQAIAMAINKQGIVASLFGGRTAVANSFVATADPNYVKDLKPWPYDPNRARATLAAAGYKPGPDGVMVRADGTRLSLDLIAGAGAATPNLIQQVVQSELKQVGIEIVAKSEPFRVLDGTTIRQRLYKGMVIEWGSGIPGSLPIFNYMSTSIPTEANAFSGGNSTSYRNPRVDALLTEGLAELDPAKRQVVWNELQEIIMDDLPRIPLFNSPVVFVSPKWMSGVTPPQSVYQQTLWIEYWKPKEK